MFQHVGRRLALLNAAVVIAIIAAVGGVTYIALQRSLDREIDNALRERIEDVQRGNLPAPTPLSAPDDDDDVDEDHDEDEEGRNILESGDTIVIVVDRAGMVIANPRGVELKDIPVRAGVAVALLGETDVRSVTLERSGRMRVITAPIVEDDQILGAVQALRSLREHEAELAVVRWMTLLGVGFGMLIAAPAGLYLASRAMRPINAAFQRQRAFVADASHELRTPLTLIRANADYLLMDESRRIADARQELQNIVAEVDRTDRLVDDLLTLARADAQQLALDLRDLDLGAAVGETTEVMRPLFDAKGVRLTATAAPGCIVRADRDRVVQVLRILLDNALRHTPRGGEVAVEVRPAERMVAVAVRDTGSGIAPEHLPRVFERFYRADPGRSRAAGGAGLGLPIARALIAAHGGEISLQSEPGRGTTVAFTLPAAAHMPRA